MSERLFLQNDRMKNEEAEMESLGHHMDWPLGPTNGARPLNIKDRN